MSSKDIIDAFDRRLYLSKHLIEQQSLPKLTYDEKRLFESRLIHKISKLQENLDRYRELAVPTQQQIEEMENIELSQMMLFWVYDQLVYGKW